MELEELKKRLDENTKKIMDNLKKIEDNSNKIETNYEKIQQNSFALEFIKDYKVGYNWWRAFALIFLILFILTSCYLGYILHDINTIEETTETYDMSTENGNNNYVGGDNNGNIENN